MMSSSFVCILAAILAGLLVGGEVGAVERVYYIAAVEEAWDYAPSGKDGLTGQLFQPSTPAGERMLPTTNRIGRVYKKALYREYTDDTFTTESPRPEWLGILGPILRAEVNDQIVVHFRNKATVPFSINPTGLTYTKSSEGALYNDGTSGAQKADDTVAPGDTYIYRWNVTAEYAGPKNEDSSSCIGWPYHSHRSSGRDMNTGLIGVTIVCRPGSLSDTEKDIVLLYSIFDENQSWFIDENIENYVPQITSADRASEEFTASNVLYTANGYSYGNLPGLELCHGDHVRFFTFTIGDETSIHSVFFNGNPVELEGKRADTIPLVPGPINVVNMWAVNPGVWLISSLSTTDATHGGSALYNVTTTCGEGTGSLGFQVEQDNIIEHFIEIQEYDWNYAPYVSKSPTGTGPIFRKARYVAYTNDSFVEMIPRQESEQYLGFIGPVIKAEVGDTIRVTLKNSAQRQYNIHPNNVMYDKGNEGWRYQDGTEVSDQFDDLVSVGATYTYTWTVPSYYGPTSQDPDCITGIYYSTAGGESDLHSGLLGPLIVCKAGGLDKSGIQSSVDREVITMVVSLNEELSWYAQENQGVQYNDDFPATEIRTINGFVSDNLRGLEMCVDEQVGWHVACIGNEETYMGLHIPFQTFVYDGRRVNTLPVNPGQTEEVQFRAQNPGTWTINGNVYNYDLEVNYTVRACFGSSRTSGAQGKERTIYLAAADVIWDYSPTEYDYIIQQSLRNQSSAGYAFVEEGDTRIGRRYQKARFIEYTDETFSTTKDRSYWDQHLGILGPIIRAEVRDTVKIVFKNLAKRPYSVNAHNLPGQIMEYNGEAYNEPLPVQPGETATFKWTLLEAAGPTAEQPNCVVWPYYSSVTTKKDTNSGMIAPLIVCRDGTLDDDGQRVDVDHDFALLYTIFDENDNWYLDDNIQMFCGQPNLVDKVDEGFENSNDAFAINGYIYGFPLNISMAVGDRVAWYIITVGGGADVHSINFHGQTVTERTHVTKNLDTVQTLPGDFITVEMNVARPGTWLLHDDVNKHSASGMETRYVVYNSRSDIPCGPDCSSAAVSHLQVGLSLFSVGMVFISLLF